jgi:hypothetical protein
VSARASRRGSLGRVSAFPLPGSGVAEPVAAPPVGGPGNWAGAPSAALDGSGGVLIAYRIRTAASRGVRIVVASAADGRQATPWCWPAARAPGMRAASG